MSHEHEGKCPECDELEFYGGECAYCSYGKECWDCGKRRESRDHVCQPTEPAPSEAGNLFTDETGTFWWKQCVTPYCQSLICRGYSEDHCYVHLPPDARARKDASFDQDP